MMTDVIIPFVY